jgi:purine-binding chemotaxis protein CheW
MSDAVSLALVRMGGRPCAIRCEHIAEIVPRVKLEHVPDSPPQVLGVINWRGRVVPVVDVRARISESSGALPPYQYLVIVEARTRPIGLAVDDVRDVRSVRLVDVEKPGELAGTRGPGVVRIDRELVLVVGPDDVLHVAS